MNIIAIIQARMGSTRLPGKVMKLLEDQTVLAHVISRVKKVKKITKIIVATSHLPEDDIIQDEALRMEVSSYRGSLADVLGRYHAAASLYQAEVVIRITADCPLLDPLLISQMLDKFLLENETNRIDYLSNSVVRTYPRGLDCEILLMTALQRAYQEATLDYQREHVTPYLYQHPNLFILYHYTNKKNLSHYRWTLDTIEDLKFISSVYQRLYKNNNCFTTDQVLDLLIKNPLLLEINPHSEKESILLPEVLDANTQ